MDQSTLGAILATGAALAVIYSWNKSRHSVPLPPGPKGHPIFGSALEISAADASWLKFAEYADQYGPVISVRILHQRMYILSDYHIVSELVEKRAANYSNKGANGMAKLIGWDKDILFMAYGPTFKRYRTMLSRALNNRVSLDYVPVQQHEVQRFLKRLLDQPSEFMEHVHLLAASIAVRIAYGHKVESHDDDFVKVAEEHMAGMSELMLPWKWIVNVIPPLRHLPTRFPIFPFQRRAAQAKRIFDTHCEAPFAYVQEQMATGTAEDSFTSKLLQPEDGRPVDNQDKEHIKCIAATLYGAGSDTTVSGVQSFFLAMALYPDVQAKAQAEIAAYLKDQSSRGMISLTDRPHLPYTSALVRELLRWHPIVPLTPRRVGKEDDDNVVSGGKTYRIPAGSLIMINMWKMLQDPEVYEHPKRFMPERYLVTNPPPDPETYAFGFGRRVCPGLHIAQQSMWLSISNLLLNFTITKSEDDNGVEIVPEERYSNGIISHPLPFVCSITPRPGCKEWLQQLVE
ncbi:hypothetical protein FS749_015728 [Ceratobasidium sp. UAMH 11750]|nr:hypothetical protein FS749_015728 [Ceratobasidium sp. UAMH 11750]